jgi:hypothetical protein
VADQAEPRKEPSFSEEVNLKDKERAMAKTVGDFLWEGSDPASSVVDADCRSWDIRNLFICDGSVFPTAGGVNPSSTIQAIACRTADRIQTLRSRGEL